MMKETEAADSCTRPAAGRRALATLVGVGVGASVFIIIWQASFFIVPEGGDAFTTDFQMVVQFVGQTLAVIVALIGAFVAGNTVAKRIDPTLLWPKRK